MGRLMEGGESQDDPQAPGLHDQEEVCVWLPLIRLLEEKAREEQKEFCMELLGSRLPGQC